ncbi:MAG: S-layer homology domain-containing protein, partial [Caldisericaceae bacterium]
SVFSLFKDVSDDYPYKEEIQTLYNLGIILGDNGEIRPKSYLKREEGFLLIYRLLKFLGKV